MEALDIAVNIFFWSKSVFKREGKELTPNGDVSRSVTAIFPCTVALVNSIMNSHLNNVGNWRIVGYCHSLRGQSMREPPVREDSPLADRLFQKKSTEKPPWSFLPRASVFFPWTKVRACDRAWSSPQQKPSQCETNRHHRRQEHDQRKGHIA